MMQIALQCDTTQVDAAARVLGSASPEETVARAIEVVIRVGELLRAVHPAAQADPAQLELLAR
jgi:hypothetical protein